MSGFRLCAHLGYLFTEMPLVERFAAAAASGFQVIEHPSPYGLGAEQFRRLCDINRLSVAQIALPAGKAGEKGLAALVDRRDDFAALLVDGVAYARAIGSPLIHPMAGVPASEADGEATWACYIDNVRLTCSVAEAAGLDVVIEPIGRGTLAGYYMGHPDLAVRAIETVGAPNLKLAFDAYHATQAGVDIVAFTREWGHRFGHVQIADDPGRHEPGSGRIDFTGFFGALQHAGYDGPIGLEYHPARTTESGLGWRRDHPNLEPLVRL